MLKINSYGMMGSDVSDNEKIRGREAYSSTTNINFLGRASAVSVLAAASLLLENFDHILSLHEE
jgi:hypothetical protein